MRAKRITVKLTGRAPVSIDPKEWPVIAAAKDYTGNIACQANEEVYLKVRQHADGRRLVYGERGDGPGGMPAGYRSAFAGRLLAQGETLNADSIAAELDNGTFDMRRLVAELMADLPTEDL